MTDGSKVIPIGIDLPVPMPWMKAADKELFQLIVHEMIDGGFTAFIPFFDEKSIFCLVVALRAATRFWEALQGTDEASVNARELAANIWLACTSAQTLTLKPEAQERLWRSLGVQFIPDLEEDAEAFVRRMQAEHDAKL